VGIAVRSNRISCHDYAPDPAIESRRTIRIICGKLKTLQEETTPHGR
jgi:hypothetical protein